MSQESSAGERHKKIVVDQQQISAVVASFLMGAFFVFLVGFAVGKRSVSEMNSFELTSGVFADTLYNAFYVLQGSAPAEESKKRKIGSQFEDAEQSGASCPEEIQGAHAQEPVKKANTVDTENDTRETGEMSGNGEAKESIYYASFAGCSTLHEAQVCAQRLEQNGVRVTPRACVSKTTNGVEHTWYQLISEQTKDKNELNVIVDRVKRLSALKDSTVVTITPEPSMPGDEERQ